MQCGYIYTPLPSKGEPFELRRNSAGRVFASWAWTFGILKKMNILFNSLLIVEINGPAKSSLRHIPFDRHRPI